MFTDIEYELFKKYGKNTISCLAGSSEKKRFYDRRTNGFISYATRGGLVLALAEPICSPDKTSELVADFHEHCRRNKLREIYFSALDESEKWFPKKLFNKYHIGDEAIITLPTNNFKKNFLRMHK